MSVSSTRRKLTITPVRFPHSQTDTALACCCKRRRSCRYLKANFLPTRHLLVSLLLPYLPPLPNSSNGLGSSSLIWNALNTMPPDPHSNSSPRRSISPQLAGNNLWLNPSYHMTTLRLPRARGRHTILNWGDQCHRSGWRRTVAEISPVAWEDGHVSGRREQEAH